MGGAILCITSSPTLRNLRLVSNRADPDDGGGGGIACTKGASPNIVDVTFFQNRAGSGGGLFCVFGSSPVMTRANFIENTARTGGGVYVEDDCAPTFSDCSFDRNLGDLAGGGVLNGGVTRFDRCTFCGNRAAQGACLWLGYFSNTRTSNSILAFGQRDRPSPASEAISWKLG